MTGTGNLEREQVKGHEAVEVDFRLAEMEKALEPQMRAKAEEIAGELAAKTAPRGLMLIIDDSPEKIRLMERRYQRSYPEGDLSGRV